MEDMKHYQLVIESDAEGNACFLDDTGECIIMIPKVRIMQVVSKLLSVANNLS